MDVDELRKEAKIAHANFDEHNLRCLRCFKSMRAYGYDKLGTPVFDNYCVSCFNDIMKHLKPTPPAPINFPTVCNRCGKRKRLYGMAWCEKCALQYQRQRLADGDDPGLVKDSVALVRRAKKLSNAQKRRTGK